MEVPSLQHLMMVLVIFMLVFGAKRIPEIAGSMGKGIKEFKKGVSEASQEDSLELRHTDVGSARGRLSRGPRGRLSRGCRDTRCTEAGPTLNAVKKPRAFIKKFLLPMHHSAFTGAFAEAKNVS